MVTRSFVSALAAAILLSGSFSSFADGGYRISATLLHKGKAFGAPVLIVKDGTASVVEVAGADGYKLTLTVTDAGEGKLLVETRLDTSYGAIAPVLEVGRGERATAAVGDLQLDIAADRAGV